MSQDDADVRKRLAAMSEADAAPAPAGARPARPARPATPRPASAEGPSAGSTQPEGPQRPPRPAAPAARAPAPGPTSPSVSPQALRVAQAPLPSGTVPVPVLRPALHPPVVEVHRTSGLADLAPTLVPACLTLGITLPLLAGGWLALDRFSVLRDNALGPLLPIGLLAGGLLFLAIAALLVAQARGDAK